MPFDHEKSRLEARLLGLLSQALQDRNRDAIVSSLLALADLYLSGDLCQKAEEYFQRILEDPTMHLARPDERARALIGLAVVALRRGQLAAASEVLERAALQGAANAGLGLEIRRRRCELDLHGGRYREVVDAMESALGTQNPERLGDLRVDLMLLEGRARRLMGRNRQALRLLERALELALASGYEAGAAGARSELGRLHTSVGKFKSAHEHLSAALSGDEGVGSQLRLNVDRRRLAFLLLQTGRWSEAEALLQQSYQSSRDLGHLECRLASQLVLANLQRLRGRLDDAQDLALDAMEAARAAGFVRRHVQGVFCLAQISHDRGQGREALETLREAEALYGRLAPESDMMLELHATIGRTQDLLGQTGEAFERLTQAQNLARETGNEYARQVVNGYLGDHFRRRGEEEKAAELLTRSARELGALGAKYDVARARLWLAELLGGARMARSLEDRHREVKLARSNAFEARRLFELMGAAPRLAECDEVEAALRPKNPAAKPK